jgi:hypothetical protein
LRLHHNLLLYYLSDKNIGSASGPAKDILYDALRKLEFLCENGSFVVISKCYLRTSRLQNFLTEDMNILCIESPDDRRWSFLKDVGVTVEPNLELYLDQLRTQKRNHALNVHDLQQGIENVLYQDLVSFCMTCRDQTVLE